MAQIKVYKLGSGWTSEHDEAADDITLNSFTAGAGPVMSPTGVDMNSTDLSDVEDVVFENPATSTINQTAGNLIIDNIMAKERSNLMTSVSAILFPAITDVAGEVDAFRIPSLTAAPTATPTESGDGFLVEYNGAIYVWDGSAWVSQKDNAASYVASSYTAEVAIAANDVVYISSAGKVSPADAGSESNARIIGLARASAAASASVEVQMVGKLAGFSGLSVGSRYYVSSTAGQITNVIPPGNSQMVVQVGIAASATELELQIIPLVIRNT